MLGILEIEFGGIDSMREREGDLPASEMQGKLLLAYTLCASMQDGATKALDALRPRPTIIKANTILGRDGRPVDLKRKGR